MKKYVFAGASQRAYNMFATPMKTLFSDCTEIVGVYDINIERARIFADSLGGFNAFDEFNEMLKEAKPDSVIVATVDAYHHEYIIKALNQGYDVISEKPMTIGAEQCKEILEAEKKSKGKLTITFNYRFVPYVTKIKEILKTGIIGDILSVDLEYFLDKNMDVSAHGASYFRRWNRYMEKSGGLLVHKSTHHFDFINWWIEDEPKEVFAFGELREYGKNGKFRGKNCRNCDYTDKCKYYVDINEKEIVKQLFTAAEHIDGYNKDGCVFAEDIDIYDTMSVNVKYKKGALLTYSLIAHAPYEGYKVSLNGSKGRLEAEEVHSGNIGLGATKKSFRIFNGDDTITTYDVPIDKSEHGGGDRRIQNMLFRENIPDPLCHMADSKAGADSLLIGVGANISIKDKRLVNIQELL